MKIPLLITALIVNFSTLSYTQDSTRVALPDSTQHKSIAVTPYFEQGIRSLGSYVKKIEDADILRFSLGVNIFNVLRGQIPGLTIPSYASSANASGLRTGPFPFVNDALLIIDGVPFNNNICNYLNLNTFDFSSISAFSNTNALNFLGGINSGAFVLTSKTGEGVVEPLFEFSAYATRGWDEIPNAPAGQPDKNGEWYIANAFAYSQDFGAVDTRVSYTLQKKFFQSYGEPYIHNLKLNTGLVASEKFDVRMFVDGRYSRFEDTVPASGRPGTTDTNETASDFFTNGNLIARYKFTNWLAVTSQLTLSHNNSNTERTGTDWGLSTATTNSRKLASFFLTGSKQVSKNISLSAFTGLQYVQQDIKQFQSRYGPPLGELENKTTWKDEIPTFITQASVNYQDVFVMSSHYKSGTHNQDNNDGDQATAYSISSSFLFSKLMGKSVMNFGKVRTSLGEHTVVAFNNYPVLNTDYYSLPINKQNPYEVKNFEIGLDAGFLDSRLLVTVNYFQNHDSYALPEFVILAIEKYSNTGWEADIRFKPINKGSLPFETGLVLSRTRSRFYERNGEGATSKPFLRVGWFNQLKFKSVVLTALIESVNNYTGYDSNTGFTDTSFTKLRDISIGIRLPNMLFVGKASQDAILSLSGRNLIKFGGSGTDIEETSGLSVFQKSISMGLHLNF